jgi:hypothetical protein
MTPTEASRALERLRLCFMDVVTGREAPAFETAWLSKAREYCAGVVVDDASIAAREEFRESGVDSARATLRRLTSMQETVGDEEAIQEAERVIATSGDPGELRSALQFLLLRSRSLAPRFAPRAMDPARALILELYALRGYECAARRECGPGSFAVISYCLQSRTPCPNDSDLDAVYRSTLAPFDYEVVRRLWAFFASGPPRTVPSG